jgi:hypothetical protein
MAIVAKMQAKMTSIKTASVKQDASTAACPGQAGRTTTQILSKFRHKWNRTDRLRCDIWVSSTEDALMPRKMTNH